MAKLIAKGAIVSKHAQLENPVRIFAYASIQGKAKIGRYTYINRHSFISGSSTIGRYCSISRAVEVGAKDHPLDMLSTHPFQYNKLHFNDVPGYTDFTRDYASRALKTTLGHDVLAGAKSIIAGGVNVGTGAVIGAGSFVKEDVPPYAIVVGSPARIIRYRFPEATIEKLLASNWWDLLPQEMEGVAFDNIDLALEQIAQVFDARAQDTDASDDTASPLADTALVEGLQQSLYEMDMPDVVVNLVMANAATISKTFDPLNPSDQEILNNKLAYLMDFMLERDPAALSVNEKNHISSLFRQKA